MLLVGHGDLTQAMFSVHVDVHVMGSCDGNLHKVCNSFVVYALSLFLFVFQVVANAVAALSEIGDVSPTAAAMMEINSQTINKLLTALNECTE